MKAGVAFLTALLFGLGLGLGGMTQPAKVRGFLDFTGAWDPSLAFVMAGAVVVYGAAFRFIRPRLARPILTPRFSIPSRRDVDAPLILGSAIFGVGWGLSGLCPGPALVAVASGGADALVFVGAMVVGLALAARLDRRRSADA